MGSVPRPGACICVHVSEPVSSVGLPRGNTWKALPTGPGPASAGKVGWVDRWGIHP